MDLDQLARYCKEKGFIFPSSEIYGGLAGFWDYGPLGVELKNNIKNEWWKTHVHEREDVVGLDGSLISHPKIWQASGHVDSFGDVMVECKKCHERIRADHLIEDKLDIQAEGLPPAEIDALIKKHKLTCPKDGGELGKAKSFNLLFKTQVGPVEGDKAIAYLRGETCQIIFTQFRNIVETGRLKLPFGIAQMGKAFRNEISPRHFIFRCREFEQMELEYFVDPKETKCPYLSEVEDYELLVLSQDLQKDNKQPKLMSMKEALEKEVILTEWHAYWLAKEHQWFVKLGVNPKHLRIRQHLQDEKSHYALDTWDLEYKFPFGWKEIQGIANRTDYDLTQHMKHSKVDMKMFIEERKEKVTPYVIAEPSLGVERTFLVFLFDALQDDKERGNLVLKINHNLAPIKVAVFPLVNKLHDHARKVFTDLKDWFICKYDKSGSVGRRYARADEQGIPYCVTVDFESLENDSVTIRDRDSTKQIRVSVTDLQNVIFQLLTGITEFEKAGKIIDAKKP